MIFSANYDNFGPHRDTTFLCTLNTLMEENDPDTAFNFMIEDVEMIVAQLADEKWWIIPNNPDDEDKCEDHGPYDDMETALVHIKLMGKPYSFFWD